MFWTKEHAEGFLYPSIVIFAGFLPWAGLLPWSVKENIQSNNDPKTLYAGRLLVAWFLVPLIFFSLIASKQPAYVLPVFPALAILVARLFEKETSDNGMWKKISLWATVAILITGAVALFIYSA